MHLSTFLALLVPAVSNSAPLTHKSFVAVWLLSAIITTALSGRWKYCALSFAGISGGYVVVYFILCFAHHLHFEQHSLHIISMCTHPSITPHPAHFHGSGYAYPDNSYSPPTPSHPTLSGPVRNSVYRILRPCALHCTAVSHPFVGQCLGTLMGHRWSHMGHIEGKRIECRVLSLPLCWDGE